MRDILDITCDEVRQWLVAGRWLSPGIPVSTNKTDRHDIAEMSLKVALNTTTLILTPYFSMSDSILL